MPTSISQLPTGFKLSVSQPVEYSVKYLDGSTKSYTEVFAQFTADKSEVDAAENKADVLIVALAAAIPAPGLGEVIGIVAALAANWIINSQRNADGSATFEFAYHYAGTSKAGIDLTAKPLPGVDAGVWKKAVDDLIAAIKALGQAAPAAGNIVAVSPQGNPA